MKLLSARDSKQLVGCLLFLFVSFSSFKSIAQNNYSDIVIENCIREVFKDKADELVFNSNSTRYDLIKNFFQRIEIIALSKTSSEKMINLTNLKLNNKYNQNLQHSVVTNIQNFNPLKYNFNMNPKVQKRVRLNDDYIISINPKK